MKHSKKTPPTGPAALVDSLGLPFGRQLLALATVSLSLLTGSSLYAAGSFTTITSIRPLAANGVPGGVTDIDTFSASHAPFNISHPFSIGSANYLFMMSTETGDTITLSLAANGGSPTTVETANVGHESWRSAVVTRTGGVSRLFLYNPDGGATRRYLINSNGTLNIGSKVDNAFTNLRDKNLVSAYAQGSNRRSFALDTFTGAAMVHAHAPQSELTTGTYSEGWTDLDHMAVGNTAYRLLYKEVGSPFKPSAMSSAGGRLVVLELGANGLARQTLLDTDIGSGWSDVRFVKLSASENGIMAYDRRSGDVWVRRFFALLPNKFYSDAVAQTTGGYDAVHSYTANGVTYSVGVRYDSAADQALKLDGEPSARMAYCVDKMIGDRAVGYQLAVLQNGQHVMNRAVGYRRLTPDLVPISRNDRINYGSVGKMFTTVSAMKAEDLGDIDLDASLAYQLPWNLGPFAQWVYNRTPRDLMAQTSGWDRDLGESHVCVGDHPNYTVDCDGMLSFEPPTTCIGNPSSQQFACSYAYYNANFGVLRQLIQSKYGVTTTQDFDALTRTLWLDDVMVGGPSCRVSASMKRFRMCKSGDSCVLQNGMSFAQFDQNPYGWDISCAAGGWHLSAKDAVRLVEQLRAEQVVSAANTADLFSTEWVDQEGDKTGHGWDNPYVARSGGSLVLGKNGGTGLESSYVSNFEGHVTASLVQNTGEGGPFTTSVLRAAYKYAVEPNSECEPYAYGYKVDTRSGGAATEVVTEMMGPGNTVIAAMRDSAGKLRMKSYSVGSTGTLNLRRNYVGESATQISIARLNSSRFAVGFKNSAGNFKIQLFNVSTVSGVMTLIDSDTAGAVRGVQLVHLGLGGAEVAAVLKMGSSKLQVIAFDMSGNSLNRKGSHLTSGGIKGASGTSKSGTGRLVTAVRTTSGKVRVIAFDVSSNGNSVQRVGTSKPADEVAGSEIRIAHVTTPGGDYFVSSMKDTNNDLATKVWSVSASGSNINRRGERTDGEVEKMAAHIASGKPSHAFVSLASGGSKPLTIPFVISDDGQTISKGSSMTQNADDATAVDAVPYFLGGSDSVIQAYVADGDFGLAHWRYLDGL